MMIAAAQIRGAQASDNERVGRVTLKAINAELARRGHNALLAKGDGYFYFWSGETADWLDRTVNVQTLGALTLKEWMDEFDRLKRLNEEIASGARAAGKPAKRKAAR